MTRTLEQFKSEPTLLVVDDTQLPRKSEKIPFVTKAYDHCENKFQNVQVVLTIGSVSGGNILAIRDAVFKRSTSSEQQLTKNDQLIQWLKDNARKIKGSTLLGDSWFTHSYIVKAAVKWYGMKFIG
ncbi:hypothetical protein [Athalassotoga sp.]